MDTNTFITQNIWWIIILAIWGYAWKAWALWRSARINQPVWFVVLLLVNTAGILDIFYLFYFSKHSANYKQIESK